MTCQKVARVFKGKIFNRKENKCNTISISNSFIHNLIMNEKNRIE